MSPVTAAALPAYEVPDKTATRIMVAVKQVATLGDDLALVEGGRRIDSSRLDHTLNEWDDAALEEALRAVERLGAGEVVAVTVGPERAEEALRKVLAKGANRAVRVWHDDLVDADAITVARALAGVAVREQPDLIFTGVQSADQAQGATGAALARILGVPHAGVVVALQWDGEGPLVVRRELEDGVQHELALPTPALVTIQTGANMARYATMRMIKEARTKPLVVLDGLAALDSGHFGRVRRIYSPEKVGTGEMLKGNPDEVAGRVLKIVREKMDG